jgi:hypothetical protein
VLGFSRFINQNIGGQSVNQTVGGHKLRYQYWRRRNCSWITLWKWFENYVTHVVNRFMYMQQIATCNIRGWLLSMWLSMHIKSAPAFLHHRSKKTISTNYMSLIAQLYCPWLCIENFLCDVCRCKTGILWWICSGKTYSSSKQCACKFSLYLQLCRYLILSISFVELSCKCKCVLSFIDGNSSGHSWEFSRSEIGR